jgi:hypothetical protein
MKLQYQNTARIEGIGVDFIGLGADFDSAIRRFEPSRPSQYSQWVENFAHSHSFRAAIPSPVAQPSAGAA